MGLDDLRKQALDADDDPFDDGAAVAVARREIVDDKMFGLNPVERMFLSIGLFLVILAISVLMLLITDSIALP
jgi:hypothetical protein